MTVEKIHYAYGTGTKCGLYMKEIVATRNESEVTCRLCRQVFGEAIPVGPRAEWARLFPGYKAESYCGSCGLSSYHWAGCPNG